MFLKLITKKSLILILTGLCGLFFLYKIANIFAPGSYPFAERYELNYSEIEVIEAINKLKLSETALIVPKVTINGNGLFDLLDGKKIDTDYWYKFYFYDKKKNQIIYTWTRPSGKNTTTFAFVSINNGLELGNWKMINEDFGYYENKKIKQSFEETILKRVKEKLNNK